VQTDHQTESVAELQGARVKAGEGWALRVVFLALLVCISAAAFMTPLRRLVALGRASEEYSYTLLIPVMALTLLFVERKKIFQQLGYSVRGGALIILAGLATAVAATVSLTSLSGGSRLALEMLGLVTVWIGCFVLCFGNKASRAAIFPLLFSLLLVPLPPPLMAKPIDWVRHGSADVTGFLFTVAGIPVVRRGMTFSLTRLTFQVATECSGIHSSIALFIAVLLAGYFCLKSAWKKALLVPLVFPIVSFTNGLRMFVIAMLSNYVDMSFFYGNLHHKGGTFFFALALALLALVARLLGGQLRIDGGASSKQLPKNLAETKLLRFPEDAFAPPLWTASKAQRRSRWE
jgi:exosortase